MPAWSGSTPIVWGDRIFLNVADDLKAQGINLHLWCVDRTSGTLLWQRPLGGGQSPGAQAEHVHAVAGHRRHARVGR